MLAELPDVNLSMTERRANGGAGVDLPDFRFAA